MRKCSRKNNNSTSLVTFHVKSLYISISYNSGLEAISFWIEKHPGSLHSKFSKGLVLQSIKIILENNNCTFNNEFYRQISGTAAGTIFAPTYETLTMGSFEVHFHNISELKWGKEFEKFILENWSRFLDGCQTQELLETSNSVDETIQFIMDFKDKAISFLDILIKRDSSEIWMDNLLINNGAFHTSLVIQNTS